MTNRKTSETYDTTCHVVDGDTVIVHGDRFVRAKWLRNVGGEVVEYAPVRTCAVVDGKCANCGDKIDLTVAAYCRCCGAKVVG